MPKVKSKPKKLSERQNSGSSGGASSSSNETQGQNQNNKVTTPKSPSKKTPKVTFKCPQGLNEFLDDCDYYVSMKTENAKLKDTLHFIGTFQLNISEPLDESILEKVDELWLYVSNIPGRSIIYTEWLEDGETGQVKEAIFYRIEESSDLSFLAGDQPGRMICFTLNPLADPLKLSIKVSLLDSYIGTGPPSVIENKCNKSVQSLMKHFFDVEVPQLKFEKGQRESVKHLDLLYTNIKEYHQLHSDSLPQVDVQNPKLQVSLRPYQVNSVNWMLQRESLFHSPPSDELHPLYQEIVTDTGEALYYNKYMGTFVKERPVVKPPTPGGILADEMGLGKTVEVLACVLANPRPETENSDDEGADIEESSEAFKPALAAADEEDDKIISKKKKRSLEISEISDDMVACLLVKPKLKIRSIKIQDSDDGRLLTEESTMSSDAKEDDEMFTKKKKCRPIEEMDDEKEEKSMEASCIREEESPVVNGEDASDENTASPVGRKRSMDNEDEDDDSTVPRKKVRFSDEIGYIPNKGKLTDLKRKAIEKNENMEVKSIIKPFEKPEHLPINDNELRAITQRSRAKARDEAYLKAISEFSAVKHLYTKKNHSGLFEGEIERKSFFECVCGVVGDTDTTYDDNKVKCTECGIVQHKKCVRFGDKMGDYYCPHCNVRRPLIEAKTTLIVAPSAISQQWMEEVNKLVEQNSLKIKFYSGVYTDGYNQPQSLAKYDIVITTYEILSKELDYVDLPHCNAADGRRFRNAKRYTSLPSPLICVQWWRVCLDEAQMVECTTTKSAEMALRLNAVNRWCITGTPVQHSLQDLYGLVMFLGVDPYCIERWWSILVQGPFIAGNPVPLCELICPLMWRTLKMDVLDQINIPPQSQEIHWINFSPIEEHFYRRQHVECASTVLDRISQQSSLDVRLQSLPKDTLGNILKPLINLRQACCHPQAVTGKFSVAVKDSNKTITMQELLANLIQKAKTECEESIRMIISSLNGIAGLNIIQERWSQAANYYREVLTLVEQNKDKIKSDKLQRIHTLCNLKELLDSDHEGVSYRDNELNLPKDIKDLESDYLAKFINLVENAKLSLEPLSTKVVEAEDQLVLDEAWWSSVISLISSLGDEEEVVERIRQAIEGMSKKSPKDSKKKMQQYKNLNAIESTLCKNTDAVDEESRKVLADMRKLQIMDPQVLVNEAVDCHLRTIITDEAKSKSRCTLCKVSDTFKTYERVLFREVTTKDNYEHLELNDVRIFGQLQTIVWAAGDTERVLKTLLNYAKLKNADEAWLKDGATHLKVIEAKKKEFKSLRFLWSQINDYISALDELNMCKLRFRLRYENEPLVKNKPKKQKGTNLGSNLENKVEHIYIIEQHDVEPQCLRLTLERSEGERSLRRRKGQLQYLLNLEQNDIASAGGENPEPCPICRKTLGTQWTVLLCGHCYCVECLEELKRRRPNKRNINCPICREDTTLGEVSYVNTKMQPEIEAKKNELDELIDMENLKKYGRHSAKAEAIVREIRKILKIEASDKILIFSAWTSMLDVLQKALTENDISCAQVKSGKKFQEAIQLFKDPLKKVTALLLPVSRGSKGLNLTEARHVFLVEPILNPASELQALGRVHRIGQDKETMVHRFIVKGTIEERMHVVLKAHQGHTKIEEDPVTVRDLFNMFASQQDTQENEQPAEIVI